MNNLSTQMINIVGVILMTCVFHLISATSEPIIISVPEIDEDVVLNKVTSVKGDNATLECITKEPHLYYVFWLKKGVEISKLPESEQKRYTSNHVYDSRVWSLTINNVNRNDAGVYQCDVVSDVGQVTAFYELEVKQNFVPCRLSESSCLNMRQCVPLLWLCDGKRDCFDNSDEFRCLFGSPNLQVINPKTDSVTEGGDLVLKCNLDVMPLRYNVSWLIDNKIYHTGLNTTLTISAITSNYSGLHTCQISNTITKKTSEPVSVHIETRKKCESDEFECGNKEACIPATFQCDGERDCTDGSDEQHCPQTSSCAADNMYCDGRCVPNKWKCDGEQDCPDGADEDNCTITCGVDQFQCSDGYCISKDWVCDGQFDCESGSDEEECVIRCRVDQFQCNHGYCISKDWVCDRQNDCASGIDEADCVTNATCTEDEKQCNNSEQCIPARWWCDGDQDCDDNSDELNCGTTSTTPAPSKEFTCNSDEVKCEYYDYCVFRTWVCDLDDDCPDGSDEKNCNNITCDDGYVPCKSRNQCVRTSWICDRSIDCIDGSDEKDCAEENTTTTTPTTTITTTTTTTTIASTSSTSSTATSTIDQGPEILENITAFVGGSVELPCYGNRSTPAADIIIWNSKEVSPDVFATAGDPDIILRDDFVDRVRVITNDEGDFKFGSLIISPVKQQDAGNYFCRLLNRYNGVPNGSYVHLHVINEPIRPCTEEEYPCKDSRLCIPLSWRCDGFGDCYDSSDEDACPAIDVLSEEQYKCNTSDTVISKALVCDGDIDCPNGDDETSCTECPDRFKCLSDNMCIGMIKKCDGERDCEDGSDEADCELKCNDDEFKCTGVEECVPNWWICDGTDDCSNGADERAC